jgi:hypothetical protein
VRAKCYGTVRREDGRFRMWYSGADEHPPYVRNIGYAESPDGIHWQRSNLGLIEYRGRRDNNIIVLDGQAPSVVVDDAEPDPARRYKMLYTPGGPTDGARFAYSPDGIRWQTFPERPAFGAKRSPFGWICANEHHSLVDDPADPERRWKSYTQVDSAAYTDDPVLARFHKRAIGLCYSADFEHWSEHPTLILDPSDGKEDQDHEASVTLYHGYYVMIYDFMYACTSCDLELAVSRDGINFTRVLNGRKVVPLGRRGEFDYSCIVSPDGFLLVDDRIYIYYCGSPENYYESAYRPNPHEEAFFRYVGLATLRRDGFTHYQPAAGGVGGELTTVPLELPPGGAAGIELYVNADLSAAGAALRACFVGAETRQAVPGLAFSDGQPLQGVDGVRLPLRWRSGGSDIAPARRKLRSPVRLQLRIEGGAKVYAFGFRAA